MINTRITKERIRNHLAYSTWKYVVLVIAAVFGWNLIYATTEYRPPKDKKVDVYFVTNAVSVETLEAFEQMAAPEFEDMEEINFFSIGINTEDDYYAGLQLSTYIGAQEGDLYIMTRDYFRSYALGGAFMPLDEVIAQGIIDLQGMDASSAYLRTDEEVSGTFGVPIGTLYGLLDYGIDNRDLYIGVAAYSQNLDNAYKMVNWLIENMSAERPDWLDAYEERESQVQETQTQDVLPSY